VLFAILLTTQLVRLLNQAAGGQLASEAVVALLGFGALAQLPVMLALTVFVSVLLTLNRGYRDSEMVVWFASGQPLAAWVRPVLAFALPVVAAIAVLTLFLTPWAAEQGKEYRERIRNREDTAQVSPGAFAESSQADRVFFVESLAEDASRVRNVFVSSVQHGRLGITVAAEGFLETRADGDRFLVLLKGRRYEGVPGTPDYRIMEFERYTVRIERRPPRSLTEGPRESPTIALLQDGAAPARGELVWRFGLPVAALLLALLALPVAFVNPRAGRTNSLLLALFAFSLYLNLLGISQSWVSQGRWRFEAGLVSVHLVAAALLALMFWWRTRAPRGARAK
jgi:lipopolysaccharide export system permease protein